MIFNLLFCAILTSKMFLYKSKMCKHKRSTQDIKEIKIMAEPGKIAEPVKIITFGGAKFDANQVASQSTTEKTVKLITL